MPYAIAICAFFGTWLLVAGSVHQAAIELDRVQVDRARLAQARTLSRRRLQRHDGGGFCPPLRC